MQNWRIKNQYEEYALPTLLMQVGYTPLEKIVQEGLRPPSADRPLVTKRALASSGGGGWSAGEWGGGLGPAAAE